MSAATQYLRFRVATCAGCGCTDHAACRTPNGACHWLAVDYSAGSGVCSACPGHLLTWWQLQGLDVYPTPRLSDAEIEAWGAWFVENALAATGLRFVAFLQEPRAIAAALRQHLPALSAPPALAERIGAGRRFRTGRILHDEIGGAPA